MEHARKMRMMPAEAVRPVQAKQAPYMVSDANIVKQDKKSSGISGRARELKLVWKIALAKGYDEYGRLIDSNGQVVANSDIGTLIGHALSHGRALVGENEFIQLLKRANVEPELILNENLKLKLINTAAPSSAKIDNTEIQVSTNEPIDAEPYDTITRVPKRTRDDETQPSDAKKGKWQIKSSQFPKMVLKKLKSKRQWVVPSESSNDKTDWEIPQSDYPKMPVRNGDSSIVSNNNNNNNNINKAADDFDKWRNTDYEDSDAESEPQEIIDDDAQLDTHHHPENKSFTLAPPKFSTSTA